MTRTGTIAALWLSAALIATGCFLGHEADDVEARPIDSGPTSADAGTRADAAPPLVWRTCEEYVAADPAMGGARCDPSTFGACARCGGTACCCETSISCGDDGVVAWGDTVCRDDCVADPPWCPGFVPSDPSCSDASACPDPSMTCLAPGERFPDCGTCRLVEDGCTGDADCDSGEVLMVCDAVPVTCACSGRPTVMGCIAHCGASGCADGFTCEADGHCRALRCMAGEYECPVNFDCIDYVAGEDPHGCTRRSCMVAADCECGACVGSRCYDGPGACVAWKPAG